MFAAQGQQPSIQAGLAQQNQMADGFDGQESRVPFQGDGQGVLLLRKVASRVMKRVSISRSRKRGPVSR